jgi:hypothetical protein
MTQRLRHVAASAIALAAVAASVVALWFRFNAPPPYGGLQFPQDLLYYYVPQIERAAERLTHGELPLWNPYACAGLPLLATLQTGVFYPPTWLAVWLPVERALPVRLLAETALGAFFAWAFLRAVGRGRLAAVAGAFLYAFSCQLGQSFWPPALSTLTWTPWLLLCVEKLVGRWRWRWWAGLALGTALQLLAGFPQYVVYSFYALAPFAAVRLLEERRAGARRVWAIGAGLVAAVALGVGLAAVQLLPTLELVGESRRVGSLTSAETHYLGYQTSVAKFLANAVDPRPKGITFGWLKDAGYVGIATLLLVGAGVVGGRRRPSTWLWLALGAAGLVLSQGFAGWTAPLHAAYAALPTGSTFRTPERLELLPLLAVLILASRGLDALGAARSPLARRVGLAALVAGVAALALVGAPGVAPRALAAAAGVAAALATQHAGLRRTSQVALALFVVADALLATAPHGSLRALPIEWSRRAHASGHTVLAPEAAEALRGSDGMRGDWAPFQPFDAVGPLGRVERITCYEPLQPSVWKQIEDAVRMRSPAGLGADGDRFATFFDVAGVARRVVGHPLATAALPSNRTLIEFLSNPLAPMRAGAPPDREPPPGLAVEIVQNPDALPRARVVHQFAVSTLADAIVRLLDGGFDFRRGVLLDRDVGPLAPPPPDAPPDGATIVRRAPERIEVRVSAHGEGLLVLSDTFYPGWRARVDGVETPTLRANGLFRAVRVPSGRHEVMWEYVPVSLRRGAALSLTSLALLAGVTVIGGLRKRRASSLRTRSGERASRGHE